MTVNNATGAIHEHTHPFQLDATFVSDSQSLQRFAEAASAVIGEQAFTSLLSRCVKGAANDFPWIPEDVRVDHGQRQLSRLNSIIDKQERLQAASSRLGLLNCLIEFLTLMIGERATDRILCQAFRRK